MTQILIVDAVNEPVAARLFPGMKIQSAVSPQVDADTDAILWCHVPERVADEFCRSAARVRIVGDEKWPIHFAMAGTARAYVQQHMTAWKAPETAQEVNGHQASAEQPKTNGAAPAAIQKPTATVTPITEARTRQQAKAEEEPVEYAEFAEDALANGFSERYPELRYVAQWGKWLAWHEAGWQEDTTLQVFDLARAYCRAAAEGQPNAALSSRRKVKSAATRSAVENLARGDRRHAATVEQWDANALHLNTPGGLVDLRNGSTRPVRMDDYCIKMAAATPVQGCPQWLEFLKFGTNGDDALIGFLQRWAGYCATGLTREQKFLFLHGRGGSGKGTFLNTIQKVLGTYAKTIAMETLIESSHDRHPEELARLVGTRMAVASETQQGKRWNEARIKMITGEDSINARLMRQDSFDFTPQVKLSLMGNHPPGLRSVDASMKRRLLIAPFDHIPENPDRLLPEKLWAERDGIMFWIVCGSIEWQTDGLAAPASVIKASADYFENQDMTGQWIADCCETGAALESTIRTLYKSYREHVEPTGYTPLRQGELRDDLYSRGFKRGGYDTAPTVKGLRVAEKKDHDGSGSKRSSANGYMPD